MLSPSPTHPGQELFQARDTRIISGASGSERKWAEHGAKKEGSVTCWDQGRGTE